MAKTSKLKFSNFFWFYYLLVFILSVYSAIVSLIGSTHIYLYAVTNYIGLLAFILSFIAIYSFHKWHYPKTTLLLPWYEAITGVSFLIIVFLKPGIVKFVYETQFSVLLALISIILCLVVYRKYWSKAKPLARKNISNKVLYALAKVIAITMLVVAIIAKFGWNVLNVPDYASGVVSIAFIVSIYLIYRIIKSLFTKDKLRGRKK